MKNEKGFTLIELLTVIVLVGIIGVIITVNIVGVLKKTQEDGCTRYINKIESVACVYASIEDKTIECNRPNCEFTLGELVTDGYFDEEKDACTGDNVATEKTITVTWNADGEKKCVYNGVRKYEK